MTTQPKRISICAKCSDMCSFNITDADGDTIYEKNDYAPHDMGIGGGDYIDLEIDIATGKIVGWNTEAVLESIAELTEDE